MSSFQEQKIKCPDLERFHEHFISVGSTPQLTRSSYTIPIICWRELTSVSWKVVRWSRLRLNSTLSNAGRVMSSWYKIDLYTLFIYSLHILSLGPPPGHFPTPHPTREHPSIACIAFNKEVYKGALAFALHTNPNCPGREWFLCITL